MSNYVWNKVICSKDALLMYFIDYIPAGIDPLETPYISFNKLFDIKSLDEYREKIGIHIYYGFGFSWAEQETGVYEIKFCTRCEYPIGAIIAAIELNHDIEWYAVEECTRYVSRFYWDDAVKENVACIDDDDYYSWSWDNCEFEDGLEDCDNSVWYYIEKKKHIWNEWESMDNFQRYVDTPAYEVECPFLNCN